MARRWLTTALPDLRDRVRDALETRLLPGGPPEDPSITAVVVHCGETTVDACLAALRDQTVRVPVQVVKDVSPLAASLDAAFAACETRWLLVVDADTILRRNCVAVLRRRLRPGVGMVVAKLHDKVYGRIGFLRLVDAEALKRVGFRHPLDDPEPDRRSRDALLSLGLSRVVLDRVVGVHDPYATPFECFRRFYGTYRKRAAERRHAERHVRAIVEYAAREGSWSEVYYMMAGLVCAALADPSRPRDYVADAEIRRQFDAIAARIGDGPADDGA